MYSFGMGVPKDASEGRHWFEAGAKLHDAMAQFNLAMTLFKQDNLMSKDVIELLRDSAHAGYVLAMHQLGLFIVRDHDARVPRDPVVLRGLPGVGPYTFPTWPSSQMDGGSGVPFLIASATARSYARAALRMSSSPRFPSWHS